MQVLIPSPLRSYTQNLSHVESSGKTLAELLNNLDKSYPGIKFRMVDEQEAIRQHIRIYVDRQPALALNLPLRGSETIQIVCALSGG
jgi:molybdopterin synthase sulfur carrier subunit